MTELSPEAVDLLREIAEEDGEDAIYAKALLGEDADDAED